MTMQRTAVILGLAALLGATAAAAAPEGRAARARAWKPGQGWQGFSMVYDADKDGKVTKDELLAKKVAFDRLDADKDGIVTEAEYDANPAARRNPHMKGWIARWDTNKDRTVSLEELNAAKMKGFERADKNKDGAIEESEFTPDLAEGGAE